MLLGVLFLTYLWYRIYKKRCITFQSNMKIVLYLQFLTGRQSVFVPISPTVYGLFDDLQMEGRRFISSIRITGLISPKLRFTWKNLFLVNTLTGNRILKKESHKISWITA